MSDERVGEHAPSKRILVVLQPMRVAIGAIAPFVIDPDALIASADEHMLRLERERYRQERADGVMFEMGGEA